MVYFAQHKLNGQIKIGHSKNIAQRIRSVGSNMKLLLIIDGNFDTEKLMHFIFSKSQIRAEWFNPTKDIMFFIKKELKKLKEEREDTDENRIRLDFINRFNSRIPIRFNFRRQVTPSVDLRLET